MVLQLGRILLLLLLVLNSRYRSSAKPIEDSSDGQNDETCLRNQNGECQSRVDEQMWSKLTRRPSHKQMCKFCDITLPIIRYLIDKNDTGHFHEIITFACVELKLADKIVCDLVVKTYQVKQICECRFFSHKT